MGLENVELAMGFEDEFGIAVPDEILQRMVTVGDFYDAVLQLVRENGRAELRSRDDLDEYLWLRVKALAAEQTRTFEAQHVRPEQITRATRFVEDLGYG